MNTLTRRNFVKAATSSAICMPALIQAKGFAKPVHPIGKAEHVISIWLGGGMGQIDTFDPKRKGDPKEKFRVPTMMRLILLYLAYNYANIYQGLLH